MSLMIRNIYSSSF